MFRKNRLLIIIAAIAIILVIVLIVGKKQGWVGGGNATDVSVEKVSRRTIIEKVSASGKIYPQVEVKLSPDVSGEITQLNVEEGDSVKEGQLLAKIKPDIYQAELDRAVAAMNTAKANYLQAKASQVQSDAQYEKADKDYQRNVSLYNNKIIASSDFETVEASYKSAKAANDGAQMSVDAAQYNVVSAAASVKQAQEDLRKTNIYAPMGGILSQLNIEKGERVLGTTQMEGTDMMHISDLNAIEARVDVSENDVLRVKLGDTSDIELDAYPDKIFKGVVTQIANSAKNQLSTSTEQVTNFVVKILLIKDSYKDLEGNSGKQFPFLPGMSASVDVMTSHVNKVMAVPIQCVTTREDSSNGGTADTAKKKSAIQEIVFMNDQGKAKAVKVKTGIQDDEYIEIKEGLKGDEQIITGPFSAISRLLKNGDPIAVVDKSKLFAKETAK
ncbi:MAG: efflux RND transporter periplasmic adaptor subunit [Chitinophagales bacterium]|nr:efflux RND transporter periplasmic adaptor subunit [Chitinophagales bacterium]